MVNQKHKQYDRVLITAIKSEIKLENVIGSEGVKRLPRIGDEATIIEIYTVNDRIDGFELECVTPEGLTSWCLTLKAKQVELTLLTRQLEYIEFKPFIDKILQYFSEINVVIPLQFKILKIAEIKYTGVGMYINFENTDNKKVDILIDSKAKNPIDGAKIVGRNFDGQSILLHKNGVIDFIEIYSYSGVLPLELNDLEELHIFKEFPIETLNTIEK
jgi:hypothetical protein